MCSYPGNVHAGNWEGGGGGTCDDSVLEIFLNTATKDYNYTGLLSVHLSSIVPRHNYRIAPNFTVRMLLS